jgi:hypothetical protein
MYEMRQMIILKYSQLIANHRCVQYIIIMCTVLLLKLGGRQMLFDICIQNESICIQNSMYCVEF